MASALEGRLEPDFQDFVGKSTRHNPSTHREDVGIVVFAGEAGRIQIVAQCRANARHLVGGDLLALAASAEHDTTIGAALDDRARDTDADGRIVYRRLTVSSVIVDDVSGLPKRLLQVLFQ